MRPRTINLPSASGQLTNEGGCIGYFAVYETTGIATASFILYDGSGAAGYEILPITLAANESTSDRIGWHYQRFETGLYYDLISGSVGGSVSVLFDHRCEEMMRPQLVVNIPIDEIAAYAASMQGV